jgi:nitrite reductase/ring-hydroxylating ferredoxin subunit
MLIEVAKLDEIVPAAKSGGGEREIVLCNDNGKVYAIGRRCGHMNAPLDLNFRRLYLDLSDAPCPV